ncbi:steroid receptor RNA activator 1 [Ostrinia nubilalis]|uniref:steroid receptor RNA activator 1 n=1 Tax=Ostrinia nubilalis TaxID=29057 RepID=UPI00308241F0
MEDCKPSGNPNNKGSFDPGWNDPPTFSYNAQQTTPNRPRNFLNKRVAFPLSGTGVSNATPPPVNMPPMPAALPVAPPVHSNPKLFQPEEGVDIDSESTLNEVKDILITFLESSSELGPKANDIKRRINMMEEMWTSGKLNKRIHLHMKELAYALRDDQPSKADDIHRALMVDHVNAVGSWMPGIKQLVHHCIARSELLNIEKE